MSSAGTAPQGVSLILGSVTEAAGFWHLRSEVEVAAIFSTGRGDHPRSAPGHGGTQFRGRMSDANYFFLQCVLSVADQPEPADAAEFWCEVADVAVGKW